MENKGFTLIELVVVITITTVLSGIILFSVSQYVNRGKDSNISGNLSILIPAGEIFYNGNNNSYSGFCDPTESTGSVLKNSIAQMPENPSGYCYSSSLTSTSNPAGVCCYEDTDAWAACVRKFSDSSDIFCVDSRGMKEEVADSDCTDIATNFKCP